MLRQTRTITLQERTRTLRRGPWYVTGMSGVPGSFAPFLTPSSVTTSDPESAPASPSPTPAFPVLLGLLRAVAAKPSGATDLQKESGLGLLEFGQALESLTSQALVVVSGPPGEELVSITDDGKALLAA